LSIIAIKASEREYASAGQSPGGRVPVPRMSTRSQETKTHEGKTSSPTQRMSLLNVNADENTSVAGPSSCRTCGTMCAACNPTRPDGTTRPDGAANVLGQQLDNLEKRLGTLGQAVNGEMMAVRNNLHGKYITRHQRRIEQGEVKMQEHEERLDNLTREAAQIGLNVGPEWEKDPNQWVYTRFIVLDGNFKADHVRQKENDDIWLLDGGGMFAKQSEFQNFYNAAHEKKAVRFHVPIVRND
jgi:hypothetical protein